MHAEIFEGSKSCKSIKCKLLTFHWILKNLGCFRNWFFWCVLIYKLKNFLFSSEILPPLSEFSCVCIFAWENLSIYASQYVLHCLPQERGIPPVPTSVSPSDSFKIMNQMRHLYWFLIGNCFMILQQRHMEEDTTFLNRLLSSADPNISPLLTSEESVSLTCLWAELAQHCF